MGGAGIRLEGSIVRVDRLHEKRNTKKCPEKPGLFYSKQKRESELEKGQWPRALVAQSLSHPGVELICSLLQDRHFIFHNFFCKPQEFGSEVVYRMVKTLI